MPSEVVKCSRHTGQHLKGYRKERGVRKEALS